jgi:hypothetical protein
MSASGIIPSDRQRRFVEELYEEYLEEASFLFDLSKAGLEARCEARLEAQLDGLVVGGEAAAQFAFERLRRADVGEIHTIARLLCRLEDWSLWSRLLAADRVQNEACMAAVAAAFRIDAPLAWLARSCAEGDLSSPIWLCCIAERSARERSGAVWLLREHYAHAPDFVRRIALQTWESTAEARSVDFDAC